MFIGSYRLLSQASKIAAVNFVDVLSFAPFSYIGTHGSSSSSRYNCRTLLDLLHRFSRSDSTRLSSDGHAGQIRAFHRGQNMSRTQQQLIVSLKPKEIGFSTQRLLYSGILNISTSIRTSGRRTSSIFSDPCSQAYDLPNVSSERACWVKIHTCWNQKTPIAELFRERGGGAFSVDQRESPASYDRRQ